MKFVSSVFHTVNFNDNFLNYLYFTKCDIPNAEVVETKGNWKQTTVISN